jgi:glycosyltransferase involved in cell wall biosynthesis
LSSEIFGDVNCAAVIPCFNEARHIAAVVRAVREHVPHVLVVDDGSADATSDEAISAGAEVLRNRVNEGKGVSLARALKTLRGRGFTWALTLDGDGQHAAEDIPAFLAEAARGDDALLIGNRMADTAAMPPLRRFANRWASARLSRRAGVALPDTQCGFRMIRLDAWSSVALTTARFEYESEIILAFVKAGHRVGFIPVRTIYADEESKFHPVYDAARWLRWWWR